MNLLTHLNTLPVLRSFGVPFHAGNVCLITYRDRLDRVPAFLNEHPFLTLEHIILADQPAGPLILELPCNGGTRPVAASGLERLLTLPHLEKIYLMPEEENNAVMLALLCRMTAKAGTPMFHIHASLPVDCVKRPPLPSFFQEHGAALESVYAMLADAESRNTFAARIKALLTGNAGYLPIAAEAEYSHPQVRLRNGEIMIDGGVSDMVDAQRTFAQSVGTAGAVYGFEPIPDMCRAAAQTLAEFPQYHMQCMGLGDRCGTVLFENARDSSRVVREATATTLSCPITTVDQFMRANDIPRLDCLKLDVEGSELAALRGAKDTIKRYTPKLIICLYHNPEDIFTIPLFIKNLVSEYELHVAHASATFLDTILYAQVKKNTPEAELEDTAPSG